MSSPRVRYQTLEFGQIDIHLRTLRDNQEYSDPLGRAARLGISSAQWSLFGVVWPSGVVMSHYLLDHDLDGKRILEVGCGIGLSSLLLNRLSADITATDYHPEAEQFLNANTDLNQDQRIPFRRMDWKETQSSLGEFDLIIGSDLLYEEGHARLLAAFIDLHAAQACSVILVDPGRGNHNKFRKQMALSGFACERQPLEDTSYLEKQFKGTLSLYSRH
ncbi:class I SAM-dependent methyltransferase [Aestuariirhabdus litorea]|uniref:Methyltransferase domain-containing protein n=1 Tax=Aestuariirhabdus litorea TaxID=2528527 RepID=A0A3P3VKV4_9GAMM|nr:methyltransferase domain-containing protein [Aestuariirhabdus litorea]RRJ83014.1 methyltransferase domain-containing protein [Aestuariirhabdus litorea]RWW93172.1 methyltransferase domain-containing protein [Endozoicomonadaceae bacterium GTF-13]